MTQMVSIDLTWMGCEPEALTAVGAVCADLVRRPMWQGNNHEHIAQRDRDHVIIGFVKTHYARPIR